MHLQGLELNARRAAGCGRDQREAASSSSKGEATTARVEAPERRALDDGKESWEGRP